MRGITILYDQATQGIMAYSRDRDRRARFKASPTLKAAPLPGNAARRSNTANGDRGQRGRAIFWRRLGLPRNACAIVVPGLGHAERRRRRPGQLISRCCVFYGAPQPRAGGARSARTKGDALMLFGVGDPLAPAGDTCSDERRLGARAGPRASSRCRSWGFPGLSAVDAPGPFRRHGGISTSPWWRLVAVSRASGRRSIDPFPTIACFAKLSSSVGSSVDPWEIRVAAPAADHAAIEKSVMRVICVRK